MVFTNATQDQWAKQLFQTVAKEMYKHIHQTKGRFDYVTQSNALNQ